MQQQHNCPVLFFLMYLDWTCTLELEADVCSDAETFERLGSRRVARRFVFAVN
jgi:hypothetical protein